MSARQTRRQFLHAIGLGAGLSPFVPFLDRHAEAQAAFPQRLLLTFAPNGTIESLFWPSGVDGAVTFPKGQITESLAPYKDSLIFPRNLTRPKPKGGGPHEMAMGSLWTGASLIPTAGRQDGYGYANGTSIDQIIAQKISAPTLYKSLAISVANAEQLGGDTDPSTMYMTYTAPNQPVLPDADPYSVWNTLMLSGSSGPVTPAALAQVNKQKSSVIDLVLAELNVLNGKIDVQDRQKVESHISGLRNIEKRLQAMAASGAGMGTSSCSAMPPPTGYQTLLYDNDSFPALVKIQTDLTVAALACDCTRIATLQWSRTFSMLRHTWLGDPNAPEHHPNSHLTTVEAVNWQYRMSYWYCQQFAYLLQAMSQVKEGSGTLLDNSLVVWGYDMNLGAGHIFPPAIVVLAGKLGGQMKTNIGGRLIDFAGGNDWTQLLTTICHAMGLTDVASVGDLGIPGLVPGLLVA